VQTVLTQLSRLSPGPFDCIVHLGAGADADSADYSALDPKHIVLIEADPESHTALAERFADTPHATVIQALVTPQEADTTFNRFTLPSFNAPLGLGRLGELYPRIELVEELRIQGQPLHEIVREPVLGDRNLLIFDIPGQEAAVLRALPFEFLERFNSMVVLASSEAWQEGAEPLEATLATLKDKQFELAREGSEDPAWPVILLQRDEAKVKLQEELDRNARLFVGKATQIHQQTEKIAELEKQLASMATTCREAETEKARALRRLSATEKSTKSAVKKRALAASERKKADHARRKQLEALIAERDALATRVSSLESEHADLATRHSSLATALEELRGQHSSLSTLHSSLVAERDDLATRHSSLVTALQDLQGQHSSLIAERDALAQERNQAITERDTLAARVSSLESDHSSLSTLHCSLIAERDDLVTRHTSLVTALEQLQGQHSSLVAERDALTTALQGLEGRLQNLGTENVSLHAGLAQAQAEAENERVKNTSLSAAFGEIEQQHAALVVSGNAAADEIVALRRRVEELAQLRRQERNEINELLRTKEKLITERDSLIVNVSALEDQLVKLQSNARVIEEEFTKAEGQIDLIKEIFLREAIR
jgi:chromosome segregation ATPase